MWKCSTDACRPRTVHKRRRLLLRFRSRRMRAQDVATVDGGTSCGVWRRSSWNSWPTCCITWRRRRCKKLQTTSSGVSNSIWTDKWTFVRSFVRWWSSLLELFWFNLSIWCELTSDDDEETVNLALAALIFSSYALLFGLKRKVLILCRFKATCRLVNMGLKPLVFVRSFDCPFVRGQSDKHTNGCVRLSARGSLPLNVAPFAELFFYQSYPDDRTCVLNRFFGFNFRTVVCRLTFAFHLFFCQIYPFLGTIHRKAVATKAQ